MSFHGIYSILSGLSVAGAWAFLTPFGIGSVAEAGAGFVVGMVVYTLIAVVHSGRETRRA